jgi:glycosyltransferase involved in cell wall biosynthesis
MKNQSENRPHISVVIPAYNEESLLPSTIHSIKESFKELDESYEIIVADNNSTDSTSTLAKDLNCKVVHQPERSIGKTRNKGAEVAQGELILFLDADTKLAPNVLKRALEEIKKDRIAAVSTISSFDKYKTLFSLGVWIYNVLSKILRLGVGQFILIRKTVFREINGFDEAYFAFEELDLFKRIKKLYGSKSFSVLFMPLKTNGRKFNSGKYDGGRFLLLLTAAILGSDVGKDKSKLDFWYGQNSGLKPNKYQKYLIITIAIMLFSDLFFIKTNSPIRDYQGYTTLFLFILFIPLFITRLKHLKYFLTVFIFTFTLEVIGILSGFPFGSYSYNSVYVSAGILGVPFYIGIAWFIIIVSLKRIYNSIIPLVFITILADIILEEFAQVNNLWSWGNVDYFTAPIQNYISWGFIAAIIYVLIKKYKPNLLVSAVSLILIFWYILSVLNLYRTDIFVLVINMLFIFLILIGSLKRAILEVSE